jgi:hypothetical protein
VKWAIRLALGLYPRRWRRRYGRELEALIEDLSIGWDGVFDLTRGAVVMQMRDFRTIPLLAALAGASIAMVIFLRAPALYAASSTIRVAGGGGSAGANSARAFLDSAVRAVPAAEARAFTAAMHVERGGESGLVKISHASRDATHAQAIVQQVVEAALDEAGGTAARVVAPPVVSTTPRRAQGGAGSVSFGAGLGLGAAFVVLRRAIGARRS